MAPESRYRTSGKNDPIEVSCTTVIAVHLVPQHPMEKTHSQANGTAQEIEASPVGGCLKGRKCPHPPVFRRRSTFEPEKAEIGSRGTVFKALVIPKADVDGNHEK